MEASLNVIKERFPEWSSSIELLYQRNASFHSLCDDYFLLTEQICKIKDADLPNSSADTAVLMTLLTELEQEIFLYIGSACNT